MLPRTARPGLKMVWVLLQLELDELITRGQRWSIGDAVNDWENHDVVVRNYFVMNMLVMSIQIFSYQFCCVNSDHHGDHRAAMVKLKIFNSNDC